jgi:phosphate transport system substrate-binding protein
MPGERSYPIVNYEYMLVGRRQPDQDTALAVRTFLAFAIDPEQGGTPAVLAAVDFVAIPSDVRPRVMAEIAMIGPA